MPILLPPHSLYSAFSSKKERTFPMESQCLLFQTELTGSRMLVSLTQRSN